MPQIVLKLSNEKVMEMLRHYKPFLKSTPAGAVFSAKTINCSITAYKSGKVLFQGKNPEMEADKWGKAVGPSSEKPSAVHAFHPPASLYRQSHIGSDEAGTGDYFGPITVAAAYIRSEQFSLLEELGVKDSKNLTDEKIKKIAKELIKEKIPYSLVILHNEKYNRLQRKGWSQGKMKAMLHHHAIRNLLEKISPEKPQGILVDQFAEPRIYINHLKTEGAKIQQDIYFQTKAESYSLAVAAGSIIARASFVNEMEKLSQKTGMELPKGASKKVDEAAASLIDKFGMSKLEEVAKVHFATTKKAEIIAGYES